MNHSLRMPGRLSCAIPALLFVAACQDAAGPAPEYRPEEAGTVDHAMCLLGFEAVPLREVATGHHLVESTINGRSGSFVLDTGANATVVEDSHVRHFDISGSSGRLGGAVGGMVGQTRARQVAIDSLEIGPIKTRQARIVATDLGQLLSMLGQVSGTTVYGLVGQDVLKEHRAVVDVAKPMLYLIPQDRDPAPVPAAKCRGEDEAKAGA